MRIWLTLGIAAALFWVAGCGVQTDPARESPAVLQERMESARVIQETPERDQTMEEIAMSSADSNVPGIAMDATREIVNSSVRDEAAAYCARKMYSAGNRVTAEEFVHLIRNGVLRDEIYEEFAS
jgi:hypothetical protein